MGSRWRDGAGLAVVAAMLAVVLCACGRPTVAARHGSPAAGQTASAHRAAAGGRTAQANPANAHRAAIATTRPAGAATVTGPVVALGDSYTAGDLMPLSLTSRPLGCLRTSDGYAAQVAKGLGASGGFVNASCSGAGVKEMTQRQRTYLGINPPQLSALAPDDSLVMLTLGGDDMGFGPGFDTCMELGVTDPSGSPCQRHYTSGGSDLLAARAAAEGAKMAEVLGEIHARAPRARVLLVGYPDLFPQQGGCWPAVPITAADIGYLRGVETGLNAALAQAAQAAGATFVDTYTATIGHDFCQSATVKDVEGLVPTSLAAPFHPNARGQAAIAAVVLAALRAEQGQGQGHGQGQGRSAG